VYEYGEKLCKKGLPTYSYKHSYTPIFLSWIFTLFPAPHPAGCVRGAAANSRVGRLSNASSAWDAENVRNAEYSWATSSLMGW
jgi:hypothetical protein